MKRIKACANLDIRSETERLEQFVFETQCADPDPQYRPQQANGKGEKMKLDGKLFEIGLAKINEQPERHEANAATIVQWVEEGRLKPAIQKTYSLDNARDALQWVADRRAVGRVVVTP